jgi:hypothetical protein
MSAAGLPQGKSVRSIDIEEKRMYKRDQREPATAYPVIYFTKVAHQNRD